MVPLTSSTTKVCDVSRTIIYRANSPTIYARVNELEFHCIYCQPILLVKFPLYTQPCKACKENAEEQNQSIKPNSLQTLETSSPLASIAKMGRNA
jgi:hypothetical protein